MAKIKDDLAPPKPPAPKPVKTGNAGGRFTPGGFVPNKPKVLPSPQDRAPYRHGQSPEQRGNAALAEANNSKAAQKYASTLAIQRTLNAHGYHVAIDGVYGPETINAYNAYLRHGAAQTNANATYADQNPIAPTGYVGAAAIKAAALAKVQHEEALKAAVPTARPLGPAPKAPNFEFGVAPPTGPAWEPHFAAGAPTVTGPFGQTQLKPIPDATTSPTLAGGYTGNTPEQEAGVAAQRRAALGIGGVVGMGLINAVAHPVTDLSRMALGQTPITGAGVASDVANIASYAIGGEIFGGLKPTEQGLMAAEKAAQAALASGKSEPEAILAARSAAAASDPRIARTIKAVYRSPVRKATLAEVKATVPKESQKAVIAYLDMGAQAAAGRGENLDSAYEKLWTEIKHGEVSPAEITGAKAPPHSFAQTATMPEAGHGSNLEATPVEHAPIDPTSRDLKNAAARLVRAHPKGLPADMKAGGLKNLLVELQGRAIEAADYRKWYENSAKAILDHVNGDPVEAQKIAQLIAVYSPRAEVYSLTSPWNNLDRAMKAYDEYKATGRVPDDISISKTAPGGEDVRGTPRDWQTHNAQNIMEGKADWNGLKTNRFYRNFLQHIDSAAYEREFGKEDFATIDTWMRRAFRYTKSGKAQTGESISPAMYHFMEQATAEVAKSLGWTTPEAQAAIWTSIKAEVEGTDLARGGLDFADAFAHRATPERQAEYAMRELVGMAGGEAPAHAFVKNKAMRAKAIRWLRHSPEAANDPEAQAIADVLDAGTRAGNSPDPDTLFQNDAFIKGAITLRGGEKGNVLRTTAHTDESTWIHEAAHALQAHVAPNMDPEAFARSVEQWVREGHTGNAALKKSFDVLSPALDRIYGDARIPGEQLDAGLATQLDHFFAGDTRSAKEILGSFAQMAHEYVISRAGPNDRTYTYEGEVTTPNEEYPGWVKFDGSNEVDSYNMHDAQGKLVGSLHAYDKSSPTDEYGTIMADQAYVHPDHRDSSVFQRLLRPVIAKADAEGKGFEIHFANERLENVMKRWARHNGREVTDLGGNGAVRFGPAPERTFAQTSGKGQSKAEAAAQHIIDQGGATLHRDFEHDVTPGGFNVSQAHTEKVIPVEDFTHEDLVAFRDANAAQLKNDKQARVGAWVSDGKVYLDISHNIPEQEAALARGVEQGQLAIWDRANADEIPTGHTEESAQAAKDKIALARAMKGDKATRREQDQLASIERGRRISAYREEQKGVDPVAEHLVGKARMRGPLPKIDHGGFTELSEEAVTQIFKDIQGHPELSDWQKVSVKEGLINALMGHSLQPRQHELLEKVIGKTSADNLKEIKTLPQHVLDAFWEAANIPRAVMASFDLSAPFRQGFVTMARHPVISLKNFPAMVKSFGSENVYKAIQEEIHARPNADLYEQSGLAVTDLEHATQGTEHQEEQYAYSNLAEKLTGLGPLVGKKAGTGSFIRMSGRAYTAYLAKTRADVFDHLLSQAIKHGVDNPYDHKFLRDLATVINSATGRGNLGRFEPAANALNTVFFSPRLMASRFNYFWPGYYMRLNKYARHEAYKNALSTLGLTGTFLALASQVPGVKVAIDPRNPNFGKIQIGNSRIDVAGGFAQELRVLAQVSTGVAISSTTGRRSDLTAAGFGKPNRLDILLRWLMGKESPLLSIGTDWARGQDLAGNKFTPASEAATHMAPLILQDARDVYNDKHGGVDGITLALAGFGTELTGFGLQTYGPRVPKPSTDLTAEAKKAGLPPPDKALLAAQVTDAQIHSLERQGDTPKDSLKLVMDWYDKTYDDPSLDPIAQQIIHTGTEGAASQLLTIIRQKTVDPRLSKYTSLISKWKEAQP